MEQRERELASRYGAGANLVGGITGAAGGGGGIVQHSAQHVPIADRNLGSVERGLNELGATVTMLQELVARLEERLGVGLLQLPESVNKVMRAPGGDRPPEPLRSSVGQRLADLVVAVQISIDRIADITQRIDL